MPKGVMMPETKIPADTPTTKYTKTGKPVYCFELVRMKSYYFDTDKDEKLRYLYGVRREDIAQIARHLHMDRWWVRARLRELGILRIQGEAEWNA